MTRKSVPIHLGWKTLSLLPPGWLFAMLHTWNNTFVLANLVNPFLEHGTRLMCLMARKRNQMIKLFSCQLAVATSNYEGDEVGTCSRSWWATYSLYLQICAENTVKRHRQTICSCSCNFQLIKMMIDTFAYMLRTLWHMPTPEKQREGCIHLLDDCGVPQVLLCYLTMSFQWTKDIILCTLD